MRRRDVLGSAIAAAALAPLGARAQPSLPVIGYLSSRSAEAETPLRTGFLEGLEQAGFVVGRDVAIEYRFTEGSFDRLPSLAAELIGLPAGVAGRDRDARGNCGEEGNRNRPDGVHQRWRSGGGRLSRQSCAAGR